MTIVRTPVHIPANAVSLDTLRHGPMDIIVQLSADRQQITTFVDQRPIGFWAAGVLGEGREVDMIELVAGRYLSGISTKYPVKLAYDGIIRESIVGGLRQKVQKLVDEFGEDALNAIVEAALTKPQDTPQAKEAIAAGWGG